MKNGWLARGGLLVSLFFGWATSQAQTFRLTDLQVRPDGRITVSSDADRYHIIYEGNTLTSFPRMVGIFLGAANEAEFVLDPLPGVGTNTVAFFRVDSLDGCNAGDLDGDGIDDFFELQQAGLDPLDLTDAALDGDNDGVSNLLEYRTQTDLNNPAEFLCAFGQILSEWPALAGEQPLQGMDTFAVEPAAEVNPFTAARDGRAGVAIAALDNDLLVDTVSVNTNANTVDVFFGQLDGTVGAPVSYSTGFSDPTLVSAAQFIGDHSPDLAVGHRGGQIAFLEGQGDGTFNLRNDLAITGLGDIVGLSHSDFDADGDEDLVASGTSQVNLLRKDDDPLPDGPIKNGRFADGLRDWTVEVLGAAEGTVPGSITEQNEQAFLFEGTSFRMSLQQTFIVPPSPVSVSFDVVALGLSDPESGLPDAFEASLLDAAMDSLVDTIHPGSTAFFNANPGDVMTTASGVVFDGAKVTVDISGLTPGSSATLYFNLIGNANGVDGSAVIDNVTTDPAVLYQDTFTVVPLSGPFSETAGITHCDLLGSAAPDIVVEDTGLDLYIVYENDGAGNFTRSEIGPNEYACPSNAMLQVEEVQYFVKNAPNTVEETPVTFTPWLAALVDDYAATYKPIWYVISQNNASTAINLDEVVNGETTVVGENDEYTFTANVGQSIYFDVQAGGVNSRNWSITDAATNVLVSAGNWSDRGPTPITLSGTHTLQVNGNSIGSYQFTIFDVPVPVTNALVLDVAQAGTIDVPGEVDVYTFAVTPPLRIYADATSGSINSFNWHLDDPNGASVFSRGNWGDSGPHDLTEAGTYVLTVDGNGANTNSYTFEINTVPTNPPVAIALDTVVAAQIDVPGEVDTFTLVVTTPVRIYGNVLLGSINSFNWYMDDPNGARVFTQGNWRDNGPHDLTVPGTYVITVDGNGSNALAYQFEINTVPVPAPVTIAFDVDVPGQIDAPGEVDIYELAITAPIEIYADAVSGSLNSFNWRMEDPNGASVFSAGNFSDRGPLVVTNSGIYRIEVDGNGDNAAAYTIQIKNVPDVPPQPIQYFRPVFDEIAVSGQIRTYTFDAVAGQTLFMQKLTGSLNSFHWDLFDPNGVLLANRANWASLNDIVVADTGTHTLIVDGNGDNASAFSFVINEVPQHPTINLPLDVIQTEAFTVAGEKYTYTFDVVAGETNFFEFIYNEGNYARIQVLRPNGNNLFSNLSNTRSHVFADTGTHTLIVTPANNQPAAFSFRRIDGDASTPLPAAADLVVTALTAPGRVVANPAGIQVSWTVSNTGTVVTAASSWKDRVWISQLDDPIGVAFPPAGSVVNGGVLDDLDQAQLVEVAAIAHNGALAPGASYEQSFNLTLPPDFEGAFWVFVQTDSENTEFEQDLETNNRLRAGNLTGIYPNLANPTGDGTLDLNIADGDTFTAGQTITVSGLARSLPEVVNLYFVVDYSASTASPSGLDANFDGQLNALDNINEDGRTGDILDVELGAIRVINQLLIDQGVFANVAYIIFAGSGIRTDFSNAMLGQYFWDTVTDTDGDGQSDFEESTLYVPSYFGTDFDFPNQELVNLLPIAPDAAVTEIFYFTDGESAQPNTNLLNAIAAEGVNLHAFQIDGTDVSASLQQVADVVDAHPNSTGEAVVVMDPNDLATVLVNTLNIAGVAVNGRGVASLDAGGRFFAPVTIQAGEQDIEVTAFDNDGNTFTQVIRVIGNPAPDTLENFVSVDLLATLTFANLSYNQKTKRLQAEARIENISDQLLSAPILAVFDDFVPGVVSLDAFDGMLADGRPYLSFDTEIVGGVLNPGATSDPVVLGISDPEELRFDLNVSLLAEGNRAPVFSSIPRVEAITGRAYSYPSNADDANGDSITYTLVNGPANMTVAAGSGVVSWSPGGADVGVHVVELRAADTRGGVGTQSFQLNVLDGSINRPPLFQSAPPIQVAGGADFNYLPSAFDPDFDPLTFALPTAPASAVFIASTGEITLSGAADGSYDFLLTVADGRGGLAQQSFTVEVGGAGGSGTGPTFLSIPPVFAIVDIPYAYLPLAEDPDGDALTYTLLNGPTNLMYNITNSLVQWTPDASQVGAHPVQIRVDDASGQFATQFYSIEVLSTPSNLPPVIISLPLAVATENEPYSYTAVATDPEGLALNFAIEDGPTGMMMNALTGELTWAPQSSDFGPHFVRLSASDPSGATGFQAFTLAVKGPNTPPMFVSTPVIEAAVDANYTYLAEAEDADDAVSYSLGTAPAGMSIDASSGLIEWMPGSVDIGDYPVTVIATDERGLSVQQTYQLAVIPDGLPPVVTVTRSNNLREPGEIVTVTVTAVDNVGVDTVSLDANGIPLALDGNNQAIFTTNDFALVIFTGTATDLNGNVGTGTTDVRFYDVGDTNPPTLIITSPLDGTIVTAPTNIVGSAFDPDGAFDYYTMEYALASELEVINGTQLSLATGPFVEFFRSSNPVTDGVLGVFDPTILPNDDYAIRVTAWDINGQGRQEGVILGVAGEFKLGQFKYEVIDLQIPIGGVPITLIRSYNSFTANRQGDFGYGWCLTVQDADIKETVPDNGLGFFGAHPFYDGVRVYLTNPDGDRVGFTFRLEMGQTSPYLGASFRPVFEPDPGVTDTLEPIPANINLGQQGDGSAVLKGLPFPYNPDAYKLTTMDGIEYVYDQQDGLQEVMDTAGNTLLVTETGLVHSTGATIAFVRDAQDRIAQIVDPDGNAITYHYDAAGDLVSVVDRNTNTFTYLYEHDVPHYLSTIIDPGGFETIRTVYDDDGRVIATIDAEGNRVEQSYDPTNFRGTLSDLNGNVYDLLYDVRGNLLVETNPQGGETTYTYDEAGNELTVLDPAGHLTTYTYDDMGNVLSESNAMGQVTVWTYNDAGMITSITDPMGGLTTNDYDAIGNLVQSVSPEGATNKYTYNRYRLEESATDPNGEVSQFIENVYGLPGQRIYPDGTTETYNYNNSGLLESSSDDIGLLFAADYDAQGTPVQFTDALGVSVDYQFENGYVVEAGDRLGQPTYYGYDGVGNIISRTNRNGDVTSYTYDGNGNQTSLTDALANQTTNNYDSLNRQVEEIDPNTNRTTWAYDAGGNPTNRVDRNGREIQMEYSAINQLVRETWVETGTVHNVIDYAYDAVGNLVRVADANGEYTFTHDGEGRILTESRAATNGIPGSTITWQRDLAGNATSIVDQDGVRIDLEYDGLNRVVSRTWQGGVLPGARHTQTWYDLTHMATQSRFADAAGTISAGSTSNRYDAARRLVEKRHLNAAGTSDLVRFDLFADAGNRVTNLVHHGRSESNTYDAIGQLLSSAGGAQDDSFSYDPLGNRSSVNHVVMIGNRLVADGETTYAYDAEGNVTQQVEVATGTSTSYTYDHRNRRVATEVRDNGNVLQSESRWVYDAMNRRIAVHENGTSTHSTYAGEYLWADHDQNAVLLAYYLVGDHVDDLLARYRPGDGLAWYLSDHLRTIHDITDAAGNIVNHYDYSVFGQRLAATTPAQSDRFGFTGRELDTTTDQYYYRARVYDPRSGRFLSEDPLGFAAGDPNLYRYVFNDPITRADPTGAIAAITYADIACTVSGAILTVYPSYANFLIDTFQAVVNGLETGEGGPVSFPKPNPFGLLLPCGLGGLL